MTALELARTKKEIVQKCLVFYVVLYNYSLHLTCIPLADAIFFKATSFKIVKFVNHHFNIGFPIKVGLRLLEH